MLKITGVILCVCGCAGYGMLQISIWNKAMDEMKQWILLFDKMKSLIFYQRDIMEEVCCLMDKRIFGIGGQYVAKIGHMVKKNRHRCFSQIWEEEMRGWEKESKLPKQIKEMIIHFPDYIGEKDCGQQVNYVEYYLTSLQKEKELLEKQIQDKKKPVMAVSLVCGLTISILLF